MSIHFADAFNQLAREKRIDREMLMEALQAGFSSAVKKKYGAEAEVVLEDDGHGNLELYMVKTVVAPEDFEDEGTQITVEEAREYSPPDEEPEPGDTIYIYVPFEEFGRNAIQITKQILMQKLREHERERVYAEYHDRVGEIVSGTVQQVDRTGILVNLGNAEATMPRRHQIRRERYTQGSSIRGCIVEVDREAKGPMVILSRTSPEFLKALFTQEVPEIYEGLIEIKAIAREAGGRSKIAVYSRDDRVDAVGACVGMKGSRVQAVVNELSGERIDIVPWSDDISSFVTRALSPARVSSVRVNHEEHSVLVIVEDDQLSLAIGKEGQNVRLASKLTGWDIELASARELEQRERFEEQLRMPVEEMVGVTERIAETLRSIGITTVQQLARTAPETLLEAPGIGPKTAEKLLATAESTAAELEKALEELIQRENEERERQKAQEKPLFDESLLDGDDDVKKLTEEELFRDPEEVEAEEAARAAGDEGGDAEDAPAPDALPAASDDAARETTAAGETTAVGETTAAGETTPEEAGDAEAAAPPDAGEGDAAGETTTAGDGEAAPDVAAADPDDASATIDGDDASSSTDDPERTG